MSTIILKHIKPNSVFANADEAIADRRRLFSPEFFQSIYDLFTTMLTDGILREPISVEWDQMSHTLTLFIKVSDVEQYESIIEPYISTLRTYTNDAGWNLLEKKIID
jgi:hypothetical protein